MATAKKRMKLYLQKVKLDALNVSPSSVYFQTLFWQTIMKYLTNIPHQQLKRRRCERWKFQPIIDIYLITGMESEKRGFLKSQFNLRFLEHTRVIKTQHTSLLNVFMVFSINFILQKYFQSSIVLRYYDRESIQIRKLYPVSSST